MSAGVALAVLCVILAQLHVPAREVSVSASSSAATDPQTLVDPPAGTAAKDRQERDVQWRSEDQTIGAWVQIDWASPQRVDRVRLLAAGDQSSAARSWLMTFGDGSSLLLTAAASGDVDVRFPARRVRSVRVTVADVPAGATAVQLAAVRVDDS